MNRFPSRNLGHEVGSPEGGLSVTVRLLRNKPCQWKGGRGDEKTKGWKRRGLWFQVSWHFFCQNLTRPVCWIAFNVKHNDYQKRTHKHTQSFDQVECQTNFQHFLFWYKTCNFGNLVGLFKCSYSPFQWAVKKISPEAGALPSFGANPLTLVQALQNSIEAIGWVQGLGALRRACESHSWGGWKNIQKINRLYDDDMI